MGEVWPGPALAEQDHPEPKNDESAGQKTQAEHPREDPPMWNLGLLLLHECFGIQSVPGAPG